MKNSFLLLFLVAYALFWSSYGQADEDQDIEEPQGMCSRAAREFINKECEGASTKPEGKKMFCASFSHYNVKLNKCFIMLGTDIKSKDSMNNLRILETKKLIDVYENKEYGLFEKYERDLKPAKCEVDKKQCSSEGEWDALVKQYLVE